MSEFTYERYCKFVEETGDAMLKAYADGGTWYQFAEAYSSLAFKCAMKASGGDKSDALELLSQHINDVVSITPPPDE